MASGRGEKREGEGIYSTGRTSGNEGKAKDRNITSIMNEGGKKLTAGRKSARGGLGVCQNRNCLRMAVVVVDTLYYRGLNTCHIDVTTSDIRIFLDVPMDEGET